MPHMWESDAPFQTTTIRRIVAFELANLCKPQAHCRRGHYSTIRGKRRVSVNIHVPKAYIYLESI